MSNSLETVLQHEHWARKQSSPLYGQLRDHIANAIRDGVIGAGDSLPSERVQQSLSILSAFTEDMARRGKTLVSEALERGLYLATLPEIMTLSLPPDSLVAHIPRPRIADKVTDTA